MRALRLTTPTPRRLALQQRPTRHVARALIPVPVYPTPEAGALALLAGLTAMFNQYSAICVMKARKAYNVPFPTLYAAGDSEQSIKFNCVQRGHQQFLENLPITVLLIGLIAQLWPRLAVGFAATWLVGRVIYFNGYASGDPKGRVPGAAISSLTQLVCMIVAVVWGAKTLIMGA